MRLASLLVLSAVSFSVAAQQQPSPPKQDKPQGKRESSYEWRIRTEGAAGGTQPPPEREREGVGAGAKPHMRFDPLDRGLHRRSDAEVVEPAK
ncbi:MAG TPA: hypothetical protein VE935_16620 [Burkholderiales bacterium]|jgi:hypothetical protein|nr:hypothetical protein [Burkholderiales bacterium]